jgi:DNA-binding HxlR family transcriptional regulator
MVDKEAFNDLLEKKYAQIVLYILLKTENHTMGFTELKNKTNGMAKNPSKGATELGSPRETDFSSRTLDEILSKAEEIGVCKRVVPDDSKEWKLLVDNLSKFQYNLIESKNRPSENHIDTASKDWDNFG